MEVKTAIREPCEDPRPVVTIGVDATIADAADMMRVQRIGCLIVTGAGGKLVGILSERDIVYRLVAPCAPPSEVLIGDIMTTDVAWCAVGTPVRKAQGIMTARGIRHLPMLVDGVPVGMISSREVMASQSARDQDMRNMTIFALAKLAESRDPETGQHLERVRDYVRELAEMLASQGKGGSEIDEKFVRLIYVTSPLHDVGKVGIPDHVLLKPGRLDDREFGIMKTHCATGAETLGSALERYPEAEFLQMARDIAACHHERVDGSGYPDGLAGEEIPLCGRIFAVADVYDALVSRRVYKDAFTHDVARSIVKEGRGTQFDPDVVEAFLHCEEKFVAIKDRYDRAKAAA